MSLPYVVVIPARLASTRLPSKPLIDILGKSLLQRTYEQCIKAVDQALVYVATDHHLIEQHCKKMKIQCVMTSNQCLTGTDRVAEFAKQVEAKFYINVQGDEPLINPKDILDIIQASVEFEGEIINGYTSIDSEDQYSSLTIPKVVKRRDGRLLYMSRAGIPGNKGGRFQKAWRQVCVYSFPKQALESFAKQDVKTELEEQEDIEILRFLELGYEVRMIPLSSDSVAVDTPDDLRKVIEVISK